MANPRSFLDKVTPVAAMRTGCAEGGVVSGAWRQFVGELLKSKIGWNFFFCVSELGGPNPMHIWVFDNQTYPIFMGFHDGFSRWMPSLESSRRDKARLPVWVAQHHHFFLAKHHRFFSIVYEFRKTIHHWILRGTLFQTKPDRMRLLGRRLWFLIRFLWSMPLSLLQILLVVGCRVYKCDWSVYLISSISSYPVLFHLILLLFFPILDI